jgi:hypothetical protein
MSPGGSTGPIYVLLFLFGEKITNMLITYNNHQSKRKNKLFRSLEKKIYGGLAKFENI